MSSDLPDTQLRNKLTPVHVCQVCGSIARRDDSDGLPTPSGLFRCSLCGHEGPLHVEVRELAETHRGSTVDEHKR